MKSTILLIEDDPLTAKLVEGQLKREGYEVLSAPNGFQGLKMARTDTPDLILLDLMLPGIDGFEVLNQLRADSQTADMPVVIVSAKTQPADKQMAAKIGADAYLTKPYDRVELMDLIQSLLSERSEPEEIPSGTCVALVAPQGREAASVALYTGLALVDRGQATTVVDFRPFSIAHSMLLSLPPRSDSASLSDPQTVARLAELAAQHPSGLRLLNNLEGSGEAGQFTPEDVQTTLDVCLGQEGFVLADLPLYPVDVLRQTAAYCAQMLMISQSDPISLTMTQSVLNTMQQAGVDVGRIGVVLIGSAEEQVPELDRPVLAAIPEDAEPDDPAFRALADRLLSLR